MENEDLNDALRMLRAPGAERWSWAATSLLMFAGVALGVAAGVILAPNYAARVMMDTYNQISSNRVVLDEAIRQATEWGISPGPDRLALYLLHVGKDSLMWTDVGIGAATGAFTTCCVAVRNVFMGKHPA